MFMTRHFTANKLLLLITVLLNFGCGKAGSNTPELISSIERIDLGRMESGESKPFSIELGATAFPIKLTSITTSCSCIASDRLSTELQLEMPRQFHFKAVAGEQVCTVYQVVQFDAEFDEKRLPSLRVPVKFYVPPFPKLSIETGQATRFHNENEIWLGGVMSLVRDEFKPPVMPKDFVAFSQLEPFLIEHVSVKHIPLPVDLVEDRIHFKLKMSADFELPPELVFKCNQDQAIRFPLECQSLNPLFLDLGAVFAGTLRKDGQVTKSVEVSNRSRQPVFVKSIEYIEDKGVVVAPLATKQIDPGETVLISFTVSCSNDFGRHGGQITITFDNPDISDLSVSLSWIEK